MRCYRFFLRHPNTVFNDGRLTPAPVIGTSCLLEEKSEPEIFFQLTKVLRAQAHDRIVLLDSLLSSPNEKQKPIFEYWYELSNVGKKNIELQLLEKKANDHELPFQLELLLCLPNKPDKLEFMLQKAVELGVTGITLLESDFTQMKHQLKRERLEKIMMEAAEQSERGCLPKLIVAEAKLKAFLSENRGDVLVALEKIAEDQQRHIRLQEIARTPLVKILIGPEGGFSPEERALFYKLQLPCFSLGKRVLRMETAAILSLGMIACRDGD